MKTFYCMLDFTTGFESINYNLSLQKKKKIKRIWITACKSRTLLMDNNYRIIKL